MKEFWGTYITYLEAFKDKMVESGKLWMSKGDNHRFDSHLGGVAWLGNTRIFGYSSQNSNDQS